MGVGSFERISTRANEGSVFVRPTRNSLTSNSPPSSTTAVEDPPHDVGVDEVAFQGDRLVHHLASACAAAGRQSRGRVRPCCACNFPFLSA